MKRHTLLAVLAVGGLALALNAQYAGLPGIGRNGPHPPQCALMQALDRNHDGVIDAREMANASAALKRLDRNGDGKLTPDELRPGRPGNPEDPARIVLMEALDTNHDGVLDAHEIVPAPASLRKLDKNGDGKLTQDELQPALITQSR